MTPAISIAIIFRTLLIVWAYGAPALRLYRTLQVVPYDTRRARRLLTDYLLVLMVGIIDVIMWGVLLFLPAVVPEAVQAEPWYTPLLTILWLGESLNFVYAGLRLGRVIEPDASDQE